MSRRDRSLYDILEDVERTDRWAEARPVVVELLGRLCYYATMSEGSVAEYRDRWHNDVHSQLAEGHPEHEATAAVRAQAPARRKKKKKRQQPQRQPPPAARSDPAVRSGYGGLSRQEIEMYGLGS